MYIPNPSKPMEAQEIINCIEVLYKACERGKWDLEKLQKWLQYNPNIIYRAAAVLDELLEAQYPPQEG